ncbi:MAG: 3-oxoacyl-ACP synthase, partial [Desulfobacteraceae bacterium]|nr:3-oxoacyl-ACP synthase [Desulfobacteraceae bacterium]
ACVLGQAEVFAFLEAHYAAGLSPRHRVYLRRLLAHPSIRKRHFALPGPEVLLAETPDQRIGRFAASATALASEAVDRALARAGVSRREVAALVVNTCTGYLCPGLSSYLIEKLELSGQVRAFDLAGSGCGGALPNLQLAGALVGQSGGPVASVAVEICSATFQMGDEPGLLLSNALFGDGAAALVAGGAPAAWQLLAAANRQVPRLREAIRYVHRDGQLVNQLSPELPRLIGETVPPLVRDLLAGQGLAPGDIAHWALHPGGARILDLLGGRLGLAAEQLAPSRSVLAEFGNLSSPTVLFVLDAITGRAEPGDFCLLLAFGAGLSAHAALLRKC